MNFANLCPGCMRELKTKTGTKCPHCGFDAAFYKQNTRCLPINTILAGKYLIGKVLGEGGFGITYIGFDLNMEVPVAIKEYFPVELVSRDTTTMHGDRVLSMSGEKSVTYKEGLKKYVAEAQNVSKFSNMPGVVSVKDFFYENDTAYIVMEYIDGISLKDYLKQKNGKLTETETLRLIRPVLEALEQIHASGIVHRDISPDNIMLTFKTDGSADSVKLIDFGAARMTEKNDQHSLTIILKHGYAPEEQYRTHGEQGPWTDVYAICATMYRMLTGMTPEPAMDRIFQDKLKRPSELGASVSKAVEEALMAGLAVKKEDRIAGIAELREALSGNRKRNGNAVRSRKSGLFIGIGAAAFFCVVGIGVFLGMQGKPKAEQAVGNQITAGDSAAEAVESAQSEAVPAEQSEVQVALETEEEEEWIVMVTADPQYSAAGGTNHTVFRKEDGTVVSSGDNAYGQRNLAEWNRVAAVAAGETFSAGLLENGTVTVAGELQGKDDVERWENIVQIAAADEHLLGLTAEGKILANMGYGDNRYDFLEWENVKAVTAGLSVLAALTEDGEVHLIGYGDSIPEKITGWEDVTAIVCNQAEIFGLTENGSVRRHAMWENSDLNSSIGTIGMEDFQNIVQLQVSISDLCGVDANGKLHKAIDEWESEEEKTLRLEQQSWENLTGAVSMMHGDEVIGITQDGGLKKAEVNYGNCELEEMADLAEVTVLPGNADRESVIGKKKDGSTFTYGKHWKLPDVPDDAAIVGELQYSEQEGFTSLEYAWVTEDGRLWMRDAKEPFGEMRPVLSDVTGIVCSYLHYQPYCAALTQDGTVSAFSARYDGAIPESILEVETWTGIKQIAGCMNRNMPEGIVLGLKNDGSVCMTSVNGQPRELNGDWTQIDSIYSGTYAVGAIRKDGTAQFLEDNPEYNFGQYNTSSWSDLTQLALGLFHTAGLREDGTVYATGRNDSGQCEVEDWTDVVYIAAGDSCTLGIRSDGTLLIAGEI